MQTKMHHQVQEIILLRFLNSITVQHRVASQHIGQVLSLVWLLNVSHSQCVKTFSTRLVLWCCVVFVIYGFWDYLVTGYLSLKRQLGLQFFLSCFLIPGCEVTGSIPFFIRDMLLLLMAQSNLTTLSWTGTFRTVNQDIYFLFVK